MNRSCLACGIAATLGLCGVAAGQTSNGVTAHNSYMIPSSPTSGVIFKSFATTLNNEFFTRTSTGVNDYRAVGVPDGMGVFRTADDITAGTFTLVVNHEITDTQGAARRFGNRGTFVSRWTVRTADLTIVSADDDSFEYNLWDIASGSYVAYNAGSPMPIYNQAAGTLPPSSFFGTQGWNPANPSRNGLSRYCSGDLAAASAYSSGVLGTTDRIYLNGEERGPSGRVFAHVLTGADAGKSYELPRLGDSSWENAVACPASQAATIVIGLDDTTPGNLYIYIGQKQLSGNTIERAGLTNGNLYGVTVPGIGVNGSGQPIETRNNVLGNTTRVESARFGLYNFGDVTNVPGTRYTNPNTSVVVDGIQEIGDANGVVNFLRPEDGAWDTRNPNRFYFVTTDNVTSSSGRSRIWAMDFDSISNPTAGGVITMLAESGNNASFSGGFTSATGATTFEMADNFTVTRGGALLIQEDVGNNPRLGRLWQYEPSNDSMVEIGISRSDRFLLNSDPAQFLTQDEETSGIVDASEILGRGWYLLDMQAHYASSTPTGVLDTELVEGGQLIALFIPCKADFDGNGTVTVPDIFAFLNAWFAGNVAADINGNGLTVSDIFDFISTWFLGCP